MKRIFSSAGCNVGYGVGRRITLWDRGWLRCHAQWSLAGCTCNANTLKFMANEGEVSPWFVTRKRVCYIERCPIYQGTHSFLEYLVHSLLSDVNCGGFARNFLVVLMFLWAVVVQLPATIRVSQETRAERTTDRNLMNLLVYLDPQLRHSNFWTKWI